MLTSVGRQQYVKKMLLTSTSSPFCLPDKTTIKSAVWMPSLLFYVQTNICRVIFYFLSAWYYISYNRSYSVICVIWFITYIILDIYI